MNIISPVVLSQVITSITTQQVEAWFTPFAYIVYLGTMLTLMVIYYQYKWTIKCRDTVKVVVVHGDGSTSVSYAPKEGSYVSITHPDTHTTRTWPINQLASIKLPYPGDGFIPMFLQKEITTVIVDEEDWEPLLNRSAYKANVASPDVVAMLRAITEDETTPDELRLELTDLVDNIRTAPTREMIASPALLGNIAHEKISELAVTVVKDVVDPLTKAISKLNRLVSPQMFFIGIGILGIIVIVLFWFSYQQADNVAAMRDELELIRRALGIAAGGK